MRSGKGSKALVAVILLFGLAELFPDARAVSSASTPAPDFTLVDRYGKKVSLRDYRGRVVLMDVWATWCGPCRRSMPEVQKWHQMFKKRGLTVLGVNIEGLSPQVVKFIDDNHYTFTVLFDQGNWQSQITRLYGITGIPRSFLVDRKGMLVWSGHPMQLNESTLQRILNGGQIN